MIHKFALNMLVKDNTSYIFNLVYNLLINSIVKQYVNSRHKQNQDSQ